MMTNKKEMVSLRCNSSCLIERPFGLGNLDDSLSAGCDIWGREIRQYGDSEWEDDLIINNVINNLFDASLNQKGGGELLLGYDKVGFPSDYGNIAPSSKRSTRPSTRKQKAQSGGAMFFPGVPVSSQVGYGLKRFSSYDMK